MHISDYLFRNAKSWPSKPALITTERTLTWQELATEVSSAAAALEKLLPDQKNQQIVATVMPNSWEYVVIYFAIIHLGHIALPVDITFKKLEIDFVLNAAKSWWTHFTAETCWAGRGCFHRISGTSMPGPLDRPKPSSFTAHHCAKNANRITNSATN